MAKLDVAGLLRYSSEYGSELGDSASRLTRLIRAAEAIHDYTSQQWQQTRNVLEQQARTKAGSSSSSGRKSILKKSARP